MKINAHLINCELLEVTDGSEGGTLFLDLRLRRVGQHGSASGDAITMRLSVMEWSPSLVTREFRKGLERLMEMRAERLKQSQDRMDKLKEAASQ